MGWIVVVVLVVGAVLLLRRAVNNAPTCICERPDCGGGCWTEEKK